MDSAIYDVFWFGFPLRQAEQSFDISIDKHASAQFSELKDILMKATEKLLDGQKQAILPLSGGLDSRLILGCLLELLPAKSIYAFNYGLPGQLDFDIPPEIAKATGIHFEQVQLSEVKLSAEDYFSDVYTMDKTPAHNAIGFGLTQMVSERAIDKLCKSQSGLEPETAIWSGFLGDRIFAGKWAGGSGDKEYTLQESCEIYADSYKNTLREKLTPASYRPEERLMAMFEKYDGEKYSSWLELMDFEQRQYRVKQTLQTLDRPYRFLFEDKKVMQAFLTCTDVERGNECLQRKFMLEYFPSLSELPVTSRFGYPLRRSPVLEKVDRYNRLARARVDKYAGTKLSRFKRKKITPSVLGEEISGYDTVVDSGLEYALEELPVWGVEIDKSLLSEIRKNRTFLEQTGSLGYLLKNASA